MALTKVENYFKNDKSLRKACRTNDLTFVKSYLENKEFGEKDKQELDQAYRVACVNRSFDVIKYLISSTEFAPNPRSVRGIADIFNNKDEQTIHWLIFEFDLRKSDAIEEVLIEMGDKHYAKYIEELFEKREWGKNLPKDLPAKDSINQHKI